MSYASSINFSKCIQFLLILTAVNLSPFLFFAACKKSVNNHSNHIQGTTDKENNSPFFGCPLKRTMISKKSSSYDTFKTVDKEQRTLYCEVKDMFFSHVSVTETVFKLSNFLFCF